MTIIGLQRRLVQVGRIRLGEQVEITKPDGSKGTRPARLEKWRLTSRDEVRLQAAAEAFGGTVQPWEERPGEFELYTEVDALPVLLMPGQAISQWYELWSGGGCKRRCDGEQEQISDGACLCNPDERECKPHTRLNVLLPDVAGIGCWRLDTQGYYAATELAGTVDLLELATARGVLLPARLRIDQRSVLRDGQTRRFPVPTLDIDIRPLEMQAITRAAARGDDEIEAPIFRPIAALPAGVSLSEGLAAANGQTEPAPQTGRSAAPIGAAADFLPVDDGPIPIDGDLAVDAPKAETKRSPKITADQKKKLNVLVGTLREAGRLHTEHLYMAVAKLRGEDPESFTEAGKDEKGELHWAALRDGLSKEESSNLIDRLEKLETAETAA